MPSNLKQIPSIPKPYTQSTVEEAKLPKIAPITPCSLIPIPIPKSQKAPKTPPAQRSQPTAFILP
jgi:hypothetical protein